MVVLNLRVPSLTHVNGGEGGDAGEEGGKEGKSLTSQGRKTPREVHLMGWLGKNSLMRWKPLELGGACHSTPSHPSTGLSWSGGPEHAQKQTQFLPTLQPQVPSLSCNRHFVFPLSLPHCHSPRNGLPFDTPLLRGWHIPTALSILRSASAVLSSEGSGSSTAVPTSLGCP